jgi:hypothetical protein
VGGLRVSGNAINAQVATAFIEAVIGHFGGFVADLQPLDQSSDQCADPAGLTAPVDIPDVSFIHNGANK